MSNLSSSDRKQDRILLNASERENGGLRLMLNAYSENFQVKGYAYFPVQELERNLAALSDFPLKQSESLLLAGGYFNAEGSDIISEHLSISVRQIDNAGHLILTAKAFIPDEMHWEMGCGKGGRCDYYITYEGLSNFSVLFSELLTASVDEMEFDSFVLR